MRPRLFLLCVFLAATPAYAVEAGEQCRPDAKLPKGFTCFDRQVYDCRSSDPTGRMGRMGYIACGGMKNDELKQVVRRLNAEILARVKKRTEEEIDHRWVREALTKSHAAWEKAAYAHCELEDSLIGKGGNASAGVMVDCERKQLESRIESLKRLRTEYLR